MAKIPNILRLLHTLDIINIKLYMLMTNESMDDITLKLSQYVNNLINQTKPTYEYKDGLQYKILTEVEYKQMIIDNSPFVLFKIRTFQQGCVNYINIKTTIESHNLDQESITLDIASSLVQITPHNTNLIDILIDKFKTALA